MGGQHYISSRDQRQSLTSDSSGWYQGSNIPLFHRYRITKNCVLRKLNDIVLYETIQKISANVYVYCLHSFQIFMISIDFDYNNNALPPLVYKDHFMLSIYIYLVAHSNTLFPYLLVNLESDC